MQATDTYTAKEFHEAIREAFSQGLREGRREAGVIIGMSRVSTDSDNKETS